MPADFDDAFELHTFDAAGPSLPPGIGPPHHPPGLIGGSPHSGTASSPPPSGTAPPASALASAISFAASRASARLLDLFLGRFRLGEHLHNLKGYLLLGKGDFVQGLMEPLLPQLSKPASQLHRHHLLALVESAVRACTSPAAAAAGGGNLGGGGGSGWVRGGSEAELLLLEHLGVTLSAAPGATGWEAFSLDYRADPPLSAVLPPPCIAEYRRAFTLLWRLKRVELSLSAVWRKHTTAARLSEGGRPDALMHGCHVLRSEMIHFVFNLQYYLMFEVIECSWEELMSSLASAANLDAVIAAHGAFLTAVITGALLSPDNAPLLESLNRLFETILRFAKAQDLLYMHMLEQRAAAKQLAASAAANTAGGRWGCTGSDAAATLLSAGAPPPLHPQFRQQLATHAAQYKRQFTAFFEQVTRHPSLDLAFLSFRLDFNSYYESFSPAAGPDGHRNPLTPDADSEGSGTPRG